MRSIRFILLSAFFTLSVFGGVVYTSCTKDACKGITCLNGGRCGGGACQCKSGLGGSNCEVIYRELYSNTYKGDGVDSTGTFYVNNTFVFTSPNDTTDYNKMQLEWTNPATRIVTMQIELNNNLPSGSSFTISATTVDSFTYTGFGIVNGTTASLTLMEAHPNSPPVSITLNNFTRQ